MLNRRVSDTTTSTFLTPGHLVITCVLQRL
jgi:hypothetical protein